MKSLFKVIGNLLHGFWHGLTICRVVIGNLIFLALIVLFFSIVFFDSEKDLPDEAALVLSLQGDIVIQKNSNRAFELVVWRIVPAGNIAQRCHRCH